MAFISLIRDLDATIKTSPFADGQVAVAHDKNKLYVDVLAGETQKRICIDNESLRDQNSTNFIYLWVGTQDEYNAIVSPRNDTIYITTDDDMYGFKIETTTSNSSIIYSLKSETTKPFLKFILA